MSLIWKPQLIEVYQEWIDAIVNEASDELNDWENTFIDVMQDRLDSGWNLTENQANKLEQIYAKYTK